LREFDKVIQELTDVLKRNERTRKEIENLRDQLFSGSSIKESRRAIEQGDNIRILTMISMIFLPLTFVTVRLSDLPHMPALLTLLSLYLA
jgi:Mg2+ and Co2+ transporter CorA